MLRDGLAQIANHLDIRSRFQLNIHHTLILQLIAPEQLNTEETRTIRVGKIVIHRVFTHETDTFFNSCTIMRIGFAHDPEIIQITNIFNLASLNMKNTIRKRDA